MNIQSTLKEYVFLGYQHDLEPLNETHTHVVRREPNITYRDEDALASLHDLSPMHYEQFLHGWSRSYYNPERHMEAITAYSQPDIPIAAVNEQIYQESVQAVKNRLSSLPRVRAFDVTTELDLVPFKSPSAAGYGYTGEKGQYMGPNHDRAIRRAKAIMWVIKESPIQGMNDAISTYVPDIGYTRTQLTDLREKTKIRNVWGRAFHYILLEGVVAAPLIQMFQSHDSFYHIGSDPIDSVPRLLSKVSKDAKWIYAIDWKQFDATVSRFEIHAAFDLVESLIDFPNVETFICFELSRQIFIHKKIAAPDGKVYWSHKGIPSGSYFTSTIGSIVNAIRIEYLWRSIKGHGPKYMYTQGDDSLCGDNDLIQPEEFAQVANQVGWNFNPEKTEYSTVPEFVSFLGRTSQGGLNARDIKKCIRLLVYPEYPVTSGRISAYRARAIADDTGGLSRLLNRIADKLERQFGRPSDEEVPNYFKRYIM